jgi:hypothetical protein
MEEAREVGPVVGLGAPSDKAPLYGIARGYFADGDWQAAVEGLCTESALIVISIADTEAVWWELRHIAEKGLLGRTLFLIDARYRDHGANRDLVERALSITVDGRRAGDVMAVLAGSNGTVLGWFFTDEGGVVALTSSTHSRTAQVCAIREFLHTWQRRGSGRVAGGGLPS